MDKAAYRLFHDKVGVARLHEQQWKIAFDPIIYGLLENIKTAAHAYTRNFSVPEVEISLSANQPHPKRCARMAGLLELEEGGRLFDRTDIFMDRPVRINGKKDEFAKPGKNARTTGDFGIPASIRGGYLMEALKLALSEMDMRIDGIPLRYVKAPKREILREVYKYMENNSMFVYHSDDSSLSLKCGDGMAYFNLDIAGCDCSQGPAVFRMLRQCTPDDQLWLIDLLIEQCAQECVLGYGAAKLRFKPVTYFEYSGTLLTTMLNNIANMCIGVHIIRNVDLTSVECCRASLEKVMLNCGWSCPAVRCDVFEGIQFLKTSPCYLVNGEIDAILNLGVILRVLGQKRGDLPGRGDLERRAFEFTAGLVSGFKHAGDHVFMSLLRSLYPKVEAIYGSNCLRYLEGSDIGSCDTNSLARRYGLQVQDIEEMCTLYQNSAYGDVIHCRASNAILELDYGLGIK